jgi:mRNA-degrading endonuclease toxin of MazEF toxin-antitoxin module
VSDRYRAGDVVWAPDPFRGDANPRPWLALAADALPYPGEEYVCAALTTSDLPRNLEVGDAWVAGSDPETTAYCSPWVLATVKHEAVASPQGRVTAAFTETVVEAARSYLGG